MCLRFIFSPWRRQGLPFATMAPLVSHEVYKMPHLQVPSKPKSIFPGALAKAEDADRRILSPSSPRLLPRRKETTMDEEPSEFAGIIF